LTGKVQGALKKKIKGGITGGSRIQHASGVVGTRIKYIQPLEGKKPDLHRSNEN